jgi:hypothetical protein
MNKIAIAKAHLTASGILLGIIAFFTAFFTWPKQTLLALVVVGAIAFLSLIYLAIYCSIREKQRGKLSDPD